MDTKMEKDYMKGGEFLIADTAEIFTPVECRNDDGDVT